MSQISKCPNMRVVLTYWEALSDVSELSLKSLLYFSSNGSYCILIIPIDRYSNDVFFQYRCRYRCWRLEYDNSLWRYCSCCCDSLWIVMLLIPHWPLPLCNNPHPPPPPPLCVDQQPNEQTRRRQLIHNSWSIYQNTLNFYVTNHISSSAMILLMR